MFYQGLECALGAHEKPYNVLGGCKNTASISSLIKNSAEPLDLLILELDSVDTDATYYVQTIIRQFPGLKILIIANRLENGRINEMMKSGIYGIVLRQCSLSDLLAAIKKIQSGSMYFCGSVSKALLDEMKTLENRSMLKLTDRELSVLRCLASGNSNNQIAEILNISISTVKTHRQHLMEKLNANNVLELFRTAHINGILAPEEDPFSSQCSLLQESSLSL